MKRLALIITSVFLLIFTANAQVDTSRNIQKEEYCMVLAYSKFLSNKVTISVDFGQETKLFAFKDTRIKDDEGKIVAFNSVIDALNFMAKQGWVFVNAYVITTSGQNVYHYVLRRSVEPK